jgi:type I restriction-modification system DNA methylase subunit
MFEELCHPNFFNDLIYAWEGDEQDFKYIMDCLNDRMHKKELGAFYTPPAYCKKATELVRKAISQIPKENDYIILDRCAGTGNLEEFLTDEELSHVIVNTFELKE